MSGIGRTLCGVTVALLLASTAGAGPLGGPAMTPEAGSAWSAISGEMFSGRTIRDGAGLVRLDAPYRAADDRRVGIAVAATLPGDEAIKAIHLVIDENPMPVSAVFELDQPRARFGVEVTMRINGPTPVRAVVETMDGDLLMVEDFVKTSGVGACAAPPVTDPEAALASLGQMQLMPEAGGPSASEVLIARAGGSLPEGTLGDARSRLSISHPSHSGMQMDQITLLYILPRYVEQVEVWDGEDRLFRMSGSISLAENPAITFTHRATAPAIAARMTDSTGTVSEHRWPLGGS